MNNTRELGVSVLKRTDATEETKRGRGTGGEFATTKIRLAPSDANESSAFELSFEAQFAREAAEKCGAVRGDESGGHWRNNIRRWLYKKGYKDIEKIDSIFDF
jgi:hypothetical protein